MSIIRQHSETEISELKGHHCDQLIGVGSTVSNGLSLFFIFVSGVMYKFFIDEGVLTWEESLQNPEDDLYDGESYIDLVSHFGIPRSGELRKIEMSDSTLKIHFPNMGLQFTNKDEMTFVTKVQYIDNLK
ncbi:hypothetical protein [Enterovibrio norvegicus]|uniref:Uncharacterized protein n=1 Tax=Enterovibrio norvegicus TaxID=188144 RepID=A0ABV4L7P4_9GAMM